MSSVGSAGTAGSSSEGSVYSEALYSRSISSGDVLESEPQWRVLCGRRKRCGGRRGGVRFSFLIAPVLIFFVVFLFVRQGFLVVVLFVPFVLVLFVCEILAILHVFVLALVLCFVFLVHDFELFLVLVFVYFVCVLV